MNLFGIVSFEKDYRLCYFINKQLNISLCLISEKINVDVNKTIYPITYYKAEDADSEYFLFANQANGSKLFPKFNKISYWLMIKEKGYVKNSEELEVLLNQISVVIGAFRITDAKMLKAISDWEFS